MLRVRNASHDLAYVEWDPAYVFESVNGSLPYSFCELYDLRRDPWQATNLCGASLPARVRDDLHAQLEAWYTCRGDDAAPSTCM